MKPETARQELRDALAAPVVTRKLARRAVIAAAALLPSVLAACAGGSLAGIQQAAQDALLIANALAAVLPQLAPLVPASTLATVTQAVQGIQAVATALANATTIGQAQSQVLQLEADLNAVIGALAGLNLPGTIGQVLTAASVLLPVIELAVNLLNPPLAPAVRALAAKTNMSVAEARLVLRAAAARR